MTEKTIKKAALVVFLLTTAYFLVLAMTSHGIRASMIKIVEVSPDFLELPPSRLADTIRFEDEKLLSEFKSRLSGVRQSHQRNVGPMEIMQWLSKTYLEKTYHRKTWLPESPSRLIDYLESHGLRGSCYSDSILYSTFAQASGWKVRHVGLNSSDGLGGSSHSVVEVWMEEYGKWILIDQQESVFFLDAKTRLPMSATEVRKKVLTLREEDFYRDVLVIQGTAFTIAKENMWNLYQSINEMHVFGSADYYTRIQRKTANKIADWLEARLEPYGQWILIGRFYRAWFGELPRLRLVDEYTPPLHYATWYYAFRINIVLWLGSIAAIVIIAIRKLFKK